MKSIKQSTILYSILMFLAAIFIGLACTDTHDTERKIDPDSHQVEGEGLPLIYHMSFISRYTKKLYFAGEVENWKLADIYSHEIEEITVDIIAGNAEHGGVDIGEMLESMLLPQIERVEEAIDSGNREMFLDRYNLLIQSCNQCHVATDYGVVVVTVPDANPFNQDFGGME